MIIYVALWIICAAWCIWSTTRLGRASVGLPAAFVLSMSFLYGGFISYLAPGYRHDRPDGDLYLISYNFDEATVFAGVEASLLGLFGFLVGTLVSKHRPVRRTSLPDPQKGKMWQGRRRLAVQALGAFGILGFALTGIDLQFSLLQAILQVARNAAVVAVCLGAGSVVLFDRSMRYGGWIAAAASIPLAYLIAFGFMSFGFIVFTCFVGFWLAVLRAQRVSLPSLLVGGAAATYLLLSGFLTWMGSRTELRAVLWGETGFFERLSSTISAFLQVQPLNFSNYLHLDLLNMRLNQYIFVGKVIEYHELHPDLRLYGESLYMALFAWVPRFLWPGKPEMGGTEFMAKHSGMQFSSEVTFGTGPVIEFYVNFGLPGVFCGFVGLGILVSWLDRRAARALYAGQFMDFARWFAVGLAFIAPLTSLFFMVNTALITLLIFTVMIGLLKLPSSRPLYPARSRGPN